MVGKGDRVERLPLPTEPEKRSPRGWSMDGPSADPVGVHHTATAGSAAVGWSDRPYRRQRMPGRRLDRIGAHRLVTRWPRRCCGPGRR